MKNITNKWWFWTAAIVVGVLVYLNYKGKTVSITDKADDTGSNTQEGKA
ncbi:MAG TPA: hypothetical protein VL098_12685 [Flavipsychrobacter sp.]|nr:hypothetical protein [Flavipsychrobacter sp.]